MTINISAGGAIIEDPEESPRASRGSRPPLERPQNRADVAGPSGTALRATIERIGMPLVVEGNPEQVRAQLEEHRKAVIREAEELARAKEEYELIVR